MNRPSSSKSPPDSEARELSKKPVCLLICAHSPSISIAAGNRIARDRIAELAGKYVLDLVLIVSRKDPVSPDLTHELGVRRLTVFRVGRMAKLIAVLLKLFSVPPRYATRFSRPALRHLTEALAATQYSLVRYEFSQVAPYQALLKPRARSVLGVHDVQLQVVLRAPIIERFLFSAFTYKYEDRLLRLFDKVTVLSQKDKNLIEGLYPYCNVEIERPTLSPFVYRVKRVPTNVECSWLLFWGAIDRPENEEAILFFVRHCMNDLKARFPDITLYVVGNAPSRKVRNLGREDVVVTGFVEDPSYYFERAALGVVPLIRGAGLKLKTLEMLEAGLPVVSTYVGAEGVDGPCDGLTVVEPSDFTQGVATVLERQKQQRSGSHI